MIHPHKVVYPNGMTALLIESHQSPVVSFNACFRVGSTVEKGAEAGICHFIEHMIFKGTPTRSAGELASTIEGLGGEINAYTSFDETVYYCTVSSRFFKEGLEVLSDSILNPLFSEEEMAREKPVVLEEISRSQDSPSRVLSEALFQTTFNVHPYGLPIIGTQESVKNFTRSQLIEFYQRWYVPENLVFVISGDFDTRKAEADLARIFKDFKKLPAPDPKIPVEPIQTAPRLSFARRPIDGHYLQLGFPIPEITSEDLPALDLLSHLLGEGLSSRLEQRIKEKKHLVDSIYSYAYTPKNPGLFVIGFTTSEEKIQAALHATLEEIFSIDEQPISHAELVRAKINIKSDTLYEKETVEGLARKYGYLETILGDYRFDQKYYQKIDEIDPDELHRVATRYFHPERLNLAVLVPESSKVSEANFSLDELLLRFKARRGQIKRPNRIQDIQIAHLSNGIRIVCRENPHLPLVSVRAVSLGGLRAENRAKNGSHHLFSELFTKGTQHRSAENLAEEIEDLAANLDAFSGRNLDGLQGEFLSEKLKESLDLFFEVLLDPAFSKEEFEKERENVLAALLREQDQPSSLVFKQMLAKLYPDHPYGLPLMGTQESVRSLNREDISAVHERFLNPAELVLVGVGDFDTKNFIDTCEKRLGSIPISSTQKLALNTPIPPTAGTQVSLPLLKKQTHLALGFLGTSIHSADRYPLEVMNNILAGQGGRLFLELRDKKSLAYSVTSFTQEGLDRGFFSVYIATDPLKKDQAIQAIFEELKKLKETPVSTAELNRAKRYLIGSYEIDLQRNAAVAGQLAVHEAYSLGAKNWRRFSEEIDKVTIKDISEVANRYLDLNAHVLSIVGG